jgi:ribosome maturation factor RimP
LTTRNPVAGNRHFEGRLESFQNGRLTLDLSAARKKFRPVRDTAQKDAAQKLDIELANVEKANLVPEI